MGTYADNRHAESMAGADQSAAVFDKVPAYRGRIVVAIDATNTRQWYWATARVLHDRLLALLPSQYPVALAIYAFRLEVFTAFSTDRNALRARAARIKPIGWYEHLPAVLRRTLDEGDVAAVINITDLTAQCDMTAYNFADRLRKRGTRVFILTDPLVEQQFYNRPTHKLFAWIAAHTGGALLPFEAHTLPALLDHFNADIRQR